jgi:sarcosine oxidase
MDTGYEAIVAGCGGPGSADLYWISKEPGPGVLGLERFGLGHDRGASQGESAFPIKASRLDRPAVSDAACEKTFHV